MSSNRFPAIVSLFGVLALACSDEADKPDALAPGLTASGSTSSGSNATPPVSTSTTSSPPSMTPSPLTPNMTTSAPATTMRPPPMPTAVPTNPAGPSEPEGQAGMPDTGGGGAAVMPGPEGNPGRGGADGMGPDGMSPGGAGPGAGGADVEPSQGGAANPNGFTPLSPGNAPVLSEGCGTATMLSSGPSTITSGGQERRYIIDIPDDYDMNKPYRFFYTSHWIDARAEDVVGQDFYFLKPLAEAAGEPAIFLAPQALPGNPTGTWDTMAPTDHVLFDDLLAFVKENLCIDTTRVFATGFSFGGMMTYSLSVNHQKDIRAAVGIAPANYNIYEPEPTNLPIAWMHTTGMDDTLCPWVQQGSNVNGSKFIALEHAEDNGCTIPDDVPAWQSGDHFCFDFEGCPAGYPVRACTFGGGHTNIDNENGVNWIAQESWEFFSQF